MPKTACCVPLCKNRGGHTFPDSKHLFKQWLIAIKRDHFYPTSTSLVCDDHFVEDDYVSETALGKHCSKVEIFHFNIIKHTCKICMLPISFLFILVKNIKYMVL